MQAINYLHMHNIFHGDIQPSNIYIDSTFKIAKLCVNIGNRNNAVKICQISYERKSYYTPVEYFEAQDKITLG